jgi:membrane protein
MTKVQDWANYFWTGIWKETTDSTKVRLLKVANLSIRSFMDRDLQSRSMSLTYSTVLAIVPAFALLLAIGKGFGLQDLLEQQLYQNFPAQKQVIGYGLKFVDSYLKEASQGMFVGIGILFLLWTLISLLSYIESAFNMIWDVKHDRTLYQKVTDYIAICLMVPVLMICSSGVSIFMSATVQDNMHFAFLTPFLNIALECSPLVLAWLAFSLSFCLIPNTKVQFKYAMVSGAICAIVFQILQMLFVNGQIYVSKYNAIYGSFAFLPLLLIWLQLSWLILLFGCVLTYSLQNVFAFNFLGDLTKMSENYERKVTIVLTAAIVYRFRNSKPPLTRTQLSFYYDIPIRVVSRICEMLYKAKIVNYIMMADDKIGIAPAMETGDLSVGELLRRLDAVGDSNFIPRFSIVYRPVLDKIDAWLSDSYKSMDSYLIKDIHLPEDADKEKVVNATPKPFLETDDADEAPVNSDL